MTRTVLTGLVILLFSTAISCAQQVSVPANVKNVRSSFSFIKIVSIAEPVKCTFVSKKMGKGAIESCDITSLKPLVLRSFGSGTVIKHVIDHTYVMTAAHVCWSPSTDTKTLGHKTITVNVKSNISVTDGVGGNYSAKIYALDTKNDICVLRAHGIFGNPVKIAKAPPTHPERVYTYGAPLAIHHPGIILLYSGFTAGGIHQKERYVNFYTLVARPGSSGSSVLNSSGEIVGLIHTAITNLQDVAIGSSLKSIQDIVKSIPEVSYERID